MNFKEWGKSVPEEIRADALWSVECYRLALFLGDICWQDATRLVKDRRTISNADQIYRAVGSVAANLEEGYSKGTGKDRARFYEYSLASARESRGWYYRCRFVLGEKISMPRIRLLTSIITLLLTMVPEQRRSGPISGRVSEEPAEYQELSLGSKSLLQLLEDVPMPEEPAIGEE